MNLLNNNKTAVTTLYSVSEIRKNKTILYWDTFHGAKDMGIGLGYQIFANCSIRSCIVTDNRTFLPVDRFDAIIFHGARYSLKQNGKPKNRTIDQKYIFYSLESYYNTDFDSWTNFNFYNWTMTFRRDSDIQSPYGVITKKLTDYTIPSMETINNKTKKVAWFVSNCRTTGSKRRLRYGRELQKHIPVDIYGTCGNLKCTDAVQCYQMLNANYKFYLAFENSFCEDYVTEKLFNILRYNVVPVVLSFADYNTIAPPYSVINTNSFMNPKHLAEYLWYLDRNYTEYVKYFEWKKEYIVENSTQYVLCQLCEKLHKPLTYSWYKNVKQWYYGYSCLQ
ncbi:alpha13-fucosyltransferase C [Carabus blaptoides fortunei]